MKIHRAEPFPWHHFSDVEDGLVDNLIIRSAPYNPGFYSRMFDEDFSRLFHSIKRKNSRQFEIVSNDDELLQKLIGNVNTRYASRRSVDETIRELVEQISRSLLWRNRAYFFLHEDIIQGKLLLHSFKPDGVVSLFGKLMQWVPKRKERHIERNGEEIPREIRILDSTKVMCFSMPRAIKRMLTAQNRILALLDKYQYRADFFPKATTENPSPTNYFDFRVWSDIQERALYRATQSTGWNGRKYDSSNRSDFFDCHRLIRFRRNQLLFRDDILKQLGAELTRVGKAYNAEFTVEIYVAPELPNVNYLNELESRLMREEAGFNEIIDYCYEH